MPGLSHDIDRITCRFDDDNAVADAGLLLTGTLMCRLGLEQSTDEMVSVGYRPGRKLATLVSSLVAGGTCIEDIDALRAGATTQILGHGTVAATTVGNWLRDITFGHVRQLDRVSETMLARAWAAGAGPGDRMLTIDVDSTIVAVHGKQKQGASYGYARELSLHPMVAVRADTGEVLHVRTRKGSANTARGAIRFVTETDGRVRRAGATGPILWRFDGGYWDRKLAAKIVDLGGLFTMGVRRTSRIVAAIGRIDDDAWVDIDDYIGARAQVAETRFDGRRLVVRRTLNQGTQPTLIEDWRHHAFVTNLDGPVLEVDRTHRAHAVVELAIRDLKNDAGMVHMPSGIFPGQRRVDPRMHARAQPRALDPAPDHQRHRRRAAVRLDVPTADAETARTARAHCTTSHAAAPAPLALAHRMAAGPRLSTWPPAALLTGPASCCPARTAGVSLPTPRPDRPSRALPLKRWPATTPTSRDTRSTLTPEQERRIQAENSLSLVENAPVSEVVLGAGHSQS